jgi:hypothetical protein
MAQHDEFHTDRDRKARWLLTSHRFSRAGGKPFPKSVEIPLPDAGWQIEEAWPAKSGLQSSLKGKSLRLDLSGEFRATIIALRSQVL